MRKTTSRRSLPHTLSAPAILFSVVRILSSILASAAEAVKYLWLKPQRSPNAAPVNVIRAEGRRHALYVIEFSNLPLFNSV